ncbi:MAG: sigma 54-interacting transcriptional regulator [Myxococcales bacterium]|nr:sigma 54-interacting transcriptional regulator [Myxococcales bacterium]
MKNLALGPGQLVAARYRLVAPLGRGSQGTVWEALDQREDGRVCALKFAGAVDVRAELEALARVEHPSLPRVLDVGSHEGSLFVVLERIAGQPLDKVVGAPAITRALFSVAEAIAAVHDAGLVHGDVKPANILVGPGTGTAERAWLVDFGLASTAERPSLVKGSLAFMAPELIAGERGPAADLYALGVSAAWALCRTHPLVDDPHDRVALLAAIARRAPVRPLLRERIAEPCRDAVLALLAFDPSERGTARTFLARLARDTTWLSPSQKHRAAAADLSRREVAPLVGRDEALDATRDALASALVRGEGVGVVLVGPEGSGRARLASEALRATRVLFATRGALCDVVDELVAEPQRPTVVRMLDASPEKLRATIDALSRMRRFAHSPQPIALLATSVAPQDEREREALSKDTVLVSLGPLARPQIRALLGSITGRAVADGSVDAYIERSDALPGRVASLALALAPAEAATATADELASVRAKLDDPASRASTLDPIAAEPYARLVVAGSSIAVAALASDHAVARRAAASLERVGLAQSDGTRIGLVAPALSATALDARWRAPARALGLALDALSWDDRRARARIAWVLGEHEKSARLARELGFDRSLSLRERAEWLSLALAAEPRASLSHTVALTLGRTLTWLGESARAEEVLAALPPSPEVLLARIDALRSRGASDRARELVIELERSGSESARVAAAALSARSKLEAGAVREASSALDGAAPSRETDAVIALRWTEVRTHLALVEGDGARGEALLASVSALLASVDERVRARFESLGGMVAQLRGESARARESYARAWSLADRAGDTRAAATYAVNLGIAEWTLGALGEARSWLERGVRSLAAFGTAYELARALANLAMLELFVGERARALDLATRAERASLESKDPTALLGARVVEAECTRAGRSLAEALASLASRELAEGRASSASETFARAALAAANAGEIDSVSEYVTHMGDADGSLCALASLARGVLSERDATTTLALIDRARSAIATDPGPEHELALLRWKSRASALDPATTASARAAYEARIEALARSLPDESAAMFRDAHPLVRARRGEERAANDESSGLAPASLKWRRLAEIARELNSEHRLRPLLERIMDAIVELTGGTRGFLLLAGPDGALRVRAARNLGRRDLAEGEGSPSRSIAERVARTGEAILTVDASNDGTLSTFESVTAMQLRSVLAVPLVVHGVSSGTVYVDDRFRAGAFGERSLEVAREFAEAAALAIHNARNSARLRRALRKSERLARALAKRVETQSVELEATRRALVTEHEPRGKYDAIIGRGSAMRRTLALCDRVAATAVPVLLLGESGTGKELVARAIHQNSPRAKKPFVAVNCAAITETLLESELFGHLRGAFTGADRARQGLFEVADGGTLFLDEVGEMSAGMQAKLLRVLQDGEVRPIGGTISRRVDVRVIAATLRDLPKLVEKGTFREDLYYRLAVLTVNVPSLRERREDVPVLVQYFLGKHGRTDVKVDRRAMARLVDYAWPGNVRQLENEVLRAALLCDGTLRESDLDPKLVARELDPDAPARSPLDLRGAIEDIERKLVERALRECRGNQSKAAVSLGLSRFGLQKMLKRLGLEETARAARA